MQNQRPSLQGYGSLSLCTWQTLEAKAEGL